MAKSKRILSVILSIVMILTVIPMGAIVTSAASDPVSSAITNDGKLVIPQVSLEATPVFRIANSGNHFLAGTTLVNATDSGLPQITGNWATKFYAGEAVHGYQVVLTSDKALSGNPTLSCSVPNLSISGPVKSGNTYTWVVSAGSATLSVGTISFTADYTYSYTDNLTGKTITNTYKAYTTSWVEYATNGVGTYQKYERTSTFTSNILTYWVHKILGKNTYGARCDGNLTFQRGYYNYETDGWVQDDSIEGFTRQSASGGDGNVTKGTGVDGNRPYAITYVDRNGGGASLASNNLRYSMFDADTGTKFTRHICWLRAIEGIVTWDETTPHSLNAGNKLGLPEIVNQFDIEGNSENHYNMTGTTYDDGATVDTATGNHISEFTIIGKAGSYYSKRDRNSNIATAVSLRIVSYDKSELRAYLADLLRENDPLTKTVEGAQIGLNPQEAWYSAGWNAYKTALLNAQAVLATPATTQKAIDSALQTLQTAVAGLVVKSANFEALEIAKANFATKVASQYTVESWNAVVNAYDAAEAVRNYNIFYQCAVDKKVAELNAALANLKYALADWTSLQEAWDAYEALDPTVYSPESFGLVRSAVEYSTAEYDLHNNEYTVLDQPTIDAMESSIWSAIDALQPAPADYTAYDAQVARYNSIVVPEKASVESALTQAGIDWQAIIASIGSETIYEKKSWNRIKNNLALERDYKYYDQEVVDDATEALRAGIDGRQFVSADYSAVNTQISAADALRPHKNWYTPESYNAVTDAVDAVVTGKKINEQPAVNAMAVAIKDAIDALEEAEANYSEYERLQGVAESLDASLYTSESYNAVFNAIDAVNQNYYAKDQALLDAEVAAIQTAINNLEYLPADYTAVDAAIRNWNARTDKNDYTAESVANVAKAISEVDRTKNITQQSEVNAMLTKINKAISNLQLKGANYDALKAQYELAKAKMNKQSSFKAANNGKDFYTANSYKALTDAVALLNLDSNGNIIENKTIRQQSEVDAWTRTLRTAIEGLTPNGADFTALQLAYDSIPEDIEEEGIYEVNSAAEVLAVAVEAQGMLDDQASFTVEDQGDIDALTAALLEAIAALQVNGANYDALIAQVNRQRNNFSDLSIYVPAKAQAVTNALSKIPMDSNGNVIQNKTIREQGEVDALALELKRALDNLEIAYADYTAVDQAIAAANAKIETGIYTNASVAAVNTAINAVVRGKYAKDQLEVNAMAKAINDKVALLEEKPLDLTSYNAAVRSIPADTSKYTAESVKAVTDAKASADTFKSFNNKISKQAEFETKVQAIVNAVAALKLKGLDLTSYNATVAKIPGDLSIYTADSIAAMNNAKKAADDFKANPETNKITKQSEFEALVSAFDKAISSLKEKPLNLERYNQAIASVPADLDLRTQASITEMNNAKNAADAFIAANNKITKQSQFDNYVDAYIAAIANLKYKPANYTELDALVEYANNLNPDDYDNYYDVYYTYIAEYVDSYIPTHRNYNITEQSKVDAMKTTLQGYIDMLNGALLSIAVDKAPTKTTYLTGEAADYTGLVVKATYAPNKVVTLETGCYTLTGFDNATAGTKTITVAFGGKTATFNVTVNWGPANYTELDARVAIVNALAETSGIAADGTVYVNFDEIYWTYMSAFIDSLPSKRGYTADRQSEVDALTAELQSYIDMLETETIVEESFNFAGTATVKTVSGVNYVSGFKLSMTEKQLTNGDYYEAQNVTVKVTKSSARYVGTGSVITVTYASGKVEEYVVVVYGDIDGNAKVDAADAAMVKLSISGSGEPLTYTQKLAANVYGAGSRLIINDQDVDAISSVAAGDAVVNQITGKV